MNFKKSVHGKTRTRPLVGQNKATYEALPQPQNSIRLTQEKIIDSLKEVLPNACFLKGFPNSAADEPTLPKLKVTTPLLDINSFTIDNMVKQNLQTITEAAVQSVNQVTKGQSSNPQWLSLRKGRITASNFYNVYTKVESIKSKKTGCDSKSLLAKIMGYQSINPNIKSLKYGREMEPVAKAEFIKMYTKEHTNVKFVECGLFIDKARPYMAASPDLLVSCSCCGEGLAEFKCPLISKCTACASFCTCNLPTCLSNNKPHTLKHGSYYSQIQGQLDITKRKWCVFYIYTCNGPFFETINFDDRFYSNILVNIEYFFTNFVKPEIYSRALQNSLQHVGTEEPMEIDSPTKGNTYFCPKCNLKISNEVIELKHRSISCDSCKLWYHFHCVGITSKNVQNVSSWRCKKCL